MKKILSLLLGILLVTSFGQVIHLNQIGFYPNSPKRAIAVECDASKFNILDAEGKVVYKGKLSLEEKWEYSGDNVKAADFSDFTQTGTFTLDIPKFGTSYPFSIKNNIYSSALEGTIKGFYYQRASTALEQKYAGKWERKAGHPDTKVIVHSSAATGSAPAGSTISSPKGWYDAGDYGKYIVNSGISCYTMLIAYEQFPELFNAQHVNIPESDNDIPDLLDEVKYNLDWMLSMQIHSPNTDEDGSVYHKLTTLNFEGHIAPYKASNQRYVIGRNTEDALNLTAVMSVAYRVFVDYDEVYAKKCLDAAKQAWDWAIKHNTGAYTNPADVKTGEYGNSDINDNYQWAALELSISTRDRKYFDQKPYNINTVGGQWWGNAKALALNSLVTNFDRQQFFSKEELTNAIVKLNTPYIEEYLETAYRTSMGHKGKGDFNWGSNSNAANHGISLIAAYQITKDKQYLDAALGNVDYLFGKNAVGYCYLTGFGSKPTTNPHHRPSWDDGIAEPVPGLLAGGPNWEKQDNCENYEGDTPAKSYCDNTCSYASNEIAINWNSPLVYLLAAVETYCK